MKLSFYPLLSPWLIVLVTGAILAASIWRIRRSGPLVRTGQRRLLMALRTASLILVALMLLCPGTVTRDLNLENSHLVFLLDTSGSMGTKDMPLEQTRLAAAVEYLKKHKFSSLKQYPRRLYTLAQHATLMPGDDLSELSAAGGTDLRQAVEQVDRDLGLNQVAALILLSDGIDHSGFRGEEVSAPIFSVPVGTAISQSPDLRFQDVVCPGKVSVREEFDVQTISEITGYPAPRDTALTITVDGNVMLKKHLQLAPGEPHAESFTHVFQEEGVHVVKVALSRLQGEVSYLNNQREIAVEVVKAKDEVAAYFPLLTASFRPLLREFQRDQDRLFTACYRVADGVYKSRGYKVNPIFRDGLPDRAAALANVQALIIGGHNEGMISLAESAVLEQYVSAGGSLLLLGGGDAFGKLPAGSPLVRLLPVQLLQDTSMQTGDFRVRPATDDGASNGFIRQLREIVARNGDDKAFVLQSINRVADVKPGAHVLAWAEEGQSYPLIVWQPYGEGKVVAVLTNSLHLWGNPAHRDANFGEFWRQLIAFSRQADADRDLLQVVVNRTELQPGDVLQVTATVNDSSLQTDQVVVSADVVDLDSKKAIHRTTLKPTQGGYVASFSDLPVGRYRLTVRALAAGETLRERYLLLMVGEGIQENARLAVHPSDFERFSSSTRIYRMDDAPRLEDDLQKILAKNEIKRERFIIFETPYAFLLLLILLLAEWGLRRRCNLV